MSKQDREIKRLNHLLGSMRKRLTVINERVADLLSNQRHYLKHRSEIVDARQKKLLNAANTFAHRIEKVPKLRVTLSKMAKSGSHRVLLMVTGNQARKLRALADSDMRGLLNSVDNRNPKNRMRLCGKTGLKTYKNT